MAARTEDSDIAREQKKAEADVDQVRARAERDRARLGSGAASPKELENLQHEIESLRRRQEDLEEIVLSVMERAEQATTRIAALEADDATVNDRVAAAERARDAAVAAIDEESAEVQAARAELAAGLPADLLALYGKLRESQGGVGAAAIRQRRCEGCRLELDINEINHIRAAGEDEVLRCDSCRRIIVRTAESGL